MFLSVIIPTRNRALLLKRTLYSLMSQTCPVSLFETIVIDNGSTDNTKETVMAFKNNLKNLKYFYDEEPGLHIGRHRGLKESDGNILVYCDDDIRAFSTWLEGISESFQDSMVAIVGGKNLPEFESIVPVWFEKLWSFTSLGKLIGHYSILDFGDNILEISPLYIWGCNYSIRKNILVEAGGFHPDGMPKELLRYRGDGETAVSKYVENKGHKTIYNPKASVYHWISTERMTNDYLYHRSFIQGISDSYSNTRANNGTSKKSILQGIRQSIKELFRPEKKIDGICNILQKGHKDGFDFHQREVANDPKLLEWVLKKTYLNI